MKNKLTPKFIEGIKPNPAKRLDFRDDLMPGLVLCVSQSGTKTFCLHRRINGKMRRLTIGRFGVLTLAEARERVRQVLYEIESCRFEERTGVEVQDRKTLGEIIPDYVEKHAKSQNRDWRNKQSLLAKFTDLHGKRLDQIKRADDRSVRGSGERADQQALQEPGLDQPRVASLEVAGTPEGEGHRPAGSRLRAGARRRPERLPSS